LSEPLANFVSDHVRVPVMRHITKDDASTRKKKFCEGGANDAERVFNTFLAFHCSTLDVSSPVLPASLCFN